MGFSSRRIQLRIHFLSSVCVCLFHAVSCFRRLAKIHRSSDGFELCYFGACPWLSNRSGYRKAWNAVLCSFSRRILPPFRQFWGPVHERRAGRKPCNFGAVLCPEMKKQNLGVGLGTQRWMILIHADALEEPTRHSFWIVSGCSGVESKTSIWLRQLYSAVSFASFCLKESVAALAVAKGFFWNSVLWLHVAGYFLIQLRSDVKFRRFFFNDSR